MRLQVTRIEIIAEEIKAFELRYPASRPLPTFEPGAHIRLHVARGLSRRYSLISDPADSSHYLIAVLHRPGGQVSSYLHHQVTPGDMVDVDEPNNGFPLAEASHSILIAGGIGITPILSHVRALAARGSSFELHYAARSRSRLPFKDALEERARFYISGEGQKMNIGEIFSAAPPGSHVYVCGPKGLLDAVRETATAQGWSADRVHFESFGAEWKITDEPLTLELSLSGLTLDVPVGKTLLEAIEEAGVWVPSDCRRGECHMCMTQIVAGEPIHRDHCLTPAERATAMTPCISWAGGRRLVLEL